MVPVWRLMVGILAIPFITRVYEQAEFGQATLVASQVAILLAFNSMGVYHSITPTRKLSRAATLASVSYVLNFVIAMIIGLVAYLLYCFEIPAFRGLGLSPMTIFAIVFLYLASSNFEVLKRYLIRFGRIRDYSVVVVLTSIAVASGKVLFGAVYPFWISLILASILAYLVPMFWLNRIFAASFSGGQNTLRRFVHIFFSHIDYVIYTTPRTIVYNLAANAHILFAGLLYGLNVTAQVGMASMLALAVGGLVSETIRETMVVKFGESSLVEMKTLLFVTTRQTLFIILFSLILMPVIPWCFSVILGPGWEDVGIFLLLLAPVVLAQIASQPAFAFLQVARRQKGLLLYEVLAAALKLISVFISYAFELDVYVFLFFYSIVGALTFVSLTGFVVARGVDFN